MENNEGFHFTYSAAQQQEVEDIRKKYLPKEEDKMEQLRKLHAIPTQKAQAASLAVGVCMMTRDRKHPVKFGFQMLPYSFLDARNNSESCKKFTDTPMWNSMLSSRITPMTKVDPPGPIISITRRWKQIALRVCPLHITCYKSIP